MADFCREQGVLCVPGHNYVHDNGLQRTARLLKVTRFMPCDVHGRIVSEQSARPLVIFCA